MNIKATVNRLKELFARLSPREKRLVLGGVVVAALILIYLVYEPISDLIDRQSDEVQAIEAQAKEAPQLIQEYRQLERQIKTIHARYKQVEFTEGVRSHLEKLAKDEAGVAAGAVQIGEQKGSELGGGYEQIEYLVRFSTQDFSRLVRFLDVLVNGRRPLLLTKLEIRKVNRRGGELEVELSVSTIRAIEKSA